MASFDELKQSNDSETWAGRACTLPTPGGGDNPGGDKTNKTVGPEGLLNYGKEKK